MAEALRRIQQEDAEKGSPPPEPAGQDSDWIKEPASSTAQEDHYDKGGPEEFIDLQLDGEKVVGKKTESSVIEQLISSAIGPTDVGQPPPEIHLRPDSDLQVKSFPAPPPSLIEALAEEGWS